MPSAKLPKYRHHKASGQAAVVLGGTWHYLGPHGSAESRDLYQRKVAEWVASGGGRSAERHADVTVSTVLDAYLSHAARLVGPTQLHRVKTALGACRRLYGEARAAEFGGRATKAVREELARTGRCRSHVNQLTSCVQRCWRWALSEELVPAAQAQSVLAVRGLRAGETSAPEGEPVRPVAPADVEATLPFLGATLADMVRVQMASGMRPGEVCRLRADELDRSQADLWVWRPKAHKNAWRGHSRQVFLGPKAVAILERRLDAAAGGYLFSPARAREERFAEMRARRKSKVQPSQRSRRKAEPKKVPGERYRRDSYAQAIARACKRAGVEPWHPNQLRHLAATTLVARYGWETARVYLGHRSVNTTRVYAEDDLKRVADAAREVG